MNLDKILNSLAILGYSMGILIMRKDYFDLSVGILNYKLFINISITNTVAYGELYSITMHNNDKVLIDEIMIDNDNFELIFNRIGDYTKEALS